MGETVTLASPRPQKGRALVSLETGSAVLRTEWVEATGAETRYRFEATAEMAPDVYAHVTLLQPHGQTAQRPADPALRRHAGQGARSRDPPPARGGVRRGADARERGRP